MHTLLDHLAKYLIAYGPVGLFLLSAIDSMGVPLPAVLDALILSVAAGSVKAPHIAWLTALLAVVGSAGGNILLFTGARHGHRLFRRKETPEAVPGRFRKWFRRYGLVTVFVPAVTPVPPMPLKFFVISAGAFRTPFFRFLAVIVVARSIRFFGEAWLGLQLGLDAQGFLIRNGWWLAGGFLLLSLVLVVVVSLVGRRPAGESGDGATSQ
ncbi:MAG TPA: VTT domain-containing protein [Bryobacteraceae bacterium]|nr:VTT domain-containing protein [Bryobacteraceae bacterium]